MKLAKKTNLVAGIDIGSSKICTVIGELAGEGIEVLGVGVSESRGYKRGVVTNVAELVGAVRQSVQSAEEEAQTSVEAVFVTAGASPSPGINTSGIANIKSKGHEVTREDIYSVTDAAKDCKIPAGTVVIHVVPQEFTLDGQMGISDPLGMMGEQLGVRIHVMVNTAAAVQNIINVVNKSGLMVAGTVMPQMASALAVLTADERELGSVVIDIGGGSTDVAVFLRGSLWFSDSIPMGGGHFTKDISVGLRTPMAEAEALKRDQGCAHGSLVNVEELLEVSSIAGKSVRLVSREMLCQVIQARAEELFGLVARKLGAWQCQRELVAGVVITGGMAHLEGLDLVAEHVFGMPVRVGLPDGAFRLGEISTSPAYSGGGGLLVYARNMLHGNEQKIVRPAVPPGLLGKASGKMRHWLMQFMA